MSNCFQRGFTLLEVLIALAVFCLGTIAVLRLQLATARAAQDAYFETVALHIGTEIAARLRSAAGTPDAFKLLSTFVYDAAHDVSPTSPTSMDCYGTHHVCNPNELVSFEIAQWQQRLRRELPAGRLQVCQDPTPWDTSARRWRWDCDGDGKMRSGWWVKLGWTSRLAVGDAAPASTSASRPQLVLHASPSLD